MYTISDLTKNKDTLLCDNDSVYLVRVGDTIEAFGDLKSLELSGHEYCHKIVDASEWFGKAEIDESGEIVTVPLRTLEKIAANKKTEIASERWQEETAPFYFESKQASFDTSERSQIKIRDAIEAGETVEWKTADGAWVTMTPSDFTALRDAYRQFVASLFAKEKEKHAAIEAADTIEAIDAITWE